MRDIFSDAINSPTGRLVDVLLKKLPAPTAESEISRALCGRLTKLVDAPGWPGQLARVRLAAEVSLLFERVPAWTKEKIVPLFDWSSADAPDVWSARKYSNYIGSPELFGLTKPSFLEMFARSDVPADDLRTFAEWLTAVMIANQAHQATYPISPTEARTALRRSGVKALSSVGHRLATEMSGGDPGQKAERWRNIVGPVFQAIWPLDVELQTSATTFKLVQLLKETGDAFPDAADIIIPFIRPDEGRGNSTVYSIAAAPDNLYALSPSRMLDLLVAVVGEPLPGSVYGLDKALDRIRAADPMVVDTRKFQKLLGYAGR